jgi:hypothetical protein
VVVSSSPSIKIKVADADEAASPRAAIAVSRIFILMIIVVGVLTAGWYRELKWGTSEKRKRSYLSYNSFVHETRVGAGCPLFSA